MPQTECAWAISEGERPRNMGWLVFMCWVISQANEWEDYYNYLGEGTGISKNWATTHILAFYGPRPWNCHGACRYAVYHANANYNANYIANYMLITMSIMRLKVYWKSNLPPSWTQLVLTSLCCIFKGFVILLKVVPCPLPSCFKFILTFNN